MLRLLLTNREKNFNRILIYHLMTSDFFSNHIKIKLVTFQFRNQNVEINFEISNQNLIFLKFTGKLLFEVSFSFQFLVSLKVNSR